MAQLPGPSQVRREEKEEFSEGERKRRRRGLTGGYCDLF